MVVNVSRTFSSIDERLALAETNEHGWFKQVKSILFRKIFV